MQERRMDIGGKLVWVLVGMLLSIFFMRTYDIACAAEKLSYMNKEDIAVLRQTNRETERRLISIESKIDKLLEIE